MNFCFLIPLINEHHETWQEDLDGLSINHAKPTDNTNRLACGLFFLSR